LNSPYLVHSKFRNRFSQQPGIKVRMDNVYFQRTNEQKNVELIRNITEEVKQACGSESKRSLGSDGFNLNIIRQV